MKIPTSNPRMTFFDKVAPSSLVGSMTSIVVSDDELSIPSEPDTVVNKVYQEWATGSKNDSILHEPDLMDVDDIFESDLIPETMEECGAALDFSLSGESPIAMTVEEEERLIHPFSPMPTMKLSGQSWDEAPFSPPLTKDKYRAACVSPTSLHGEMETAMLENEKRILSPFPSLPLTADCEKDDANLSMEERLQKASLKLAESMKRSQMTRASLTFKPMVDDYTDENDVGSLLEKIEESTKQIHQQMNMRHSSENGFSEASVRRLLHTIEDTTSQLQRRLSFTTETADQ